MDTSDTGVMPSHCPVCDGELYVTKLQCSACGTEVNGTFTLGRLATLKEPHASLLEMFLRVRGNVKEMERELGLSYPTVRARLDEAFEAAGFEKDQSRSSSRSFGGDWQQELEDSLRASVEARLDEARARVEEQMAALAQAQARSHRDTERSAERSDILARLERGEISPQEATSLLKALKNRR